MAVSRQAGHVPKRGVNRLRVISKLSLQRVLDPFANNIEGPNHTDDLLLFIDYRYLVELRKVENPHRFRKILVV